MTSPMKSKFCLMLASRPSRELAPFDGNPETDVIEWLTAFDKAFCVHRHATIGTPDQILTAKANHLYSKLAEPAYSRILNELKRYHANARDYHSIVTVMKRLYVNAASSDLARSDLARMYQLPDESVAAFSNRLSKCVDRAYPTDPTDQREKRKLEEFAVRILPVLRVTLYAANYSTFVDAIYQAERLETAYRAAGLSLTHKTPASISVYNDSPRSYEYDNCRQHSPQPRSSSSLVPHPDNKNSTTRVQFQDYAKKITYHEVPSLPRQASPPKEHEPNLSLQPPKSNLKRLESRRPSPISIPPAGSHSITSTPHTQPTNDSYWIRKNPPTTPPDYRRRSDGLVEPKTPQGFARPSNLHVADHSASRTQSSTRESSSQRQPQNDSRNFSQSPSRPNYYDNYRSRQYSQSPSNYQRPSATVPHPSLDKLA